MLEGLARWAHPAALACVEGCHRKTNWRMCIGADHQKERPINVLWHCVLFSLISAQLPKSMRMLLPTPVPTLVKASCCSKHELCSSSNTDMSGTFGRSTDSFSFAKCCLVIQCEEMCYSVSLISRVLASQRLQRLFWHLTMIITPETL